MSAIENESAATDETAELDLANLPDARITDVPLFEERLTITRDAAKRSVTEAKRSYGASDTFAATLPPLRRLIETPEGFPDWAGNTDAYSLAAQKMITDVLSDLGQNAARSHWATIKKQANRVHFLPEIIDYVLVTTPALEKELVQWNTDDLGRKNVQTSPSSALVKAVQRQYASTKKMVPPKGSAFELKTVEKPVVPKDDPESVLETLEEAMGGLVDIVPGYGLAGVHMTLSAIVQKMLDGKLSTIENRKECVSLLRQIETVASFGAKSIDTASAEKITEEDEKAYDAAVFTPAAKQ